MLWNSKWFPGTNLQDINLDWILKKVSALRGGSTGQYLYKKSDKDFDFGWKTGSGGGGGTSDYLDLDNKPSINNVELTGNKTASDLGLAAAGAYVKPASGIPKTDLANEVQESLDKADSAYVKPASGIPKTDLSSAVQTSLDKADSAYVKPATGIPKTDLSSAVQTSLDKADTALQAVPSTYRTASVQDAIDAAQDTQIESLAGSLATIESSPSTAAHAVGDYIVYNGQLYKVTAAIAAGETLTPGTNIVQATYGEQIANLESNKMDKVVLTAGSVWNFYGAYGYFVDDNATSLVITIPVTTQVPVTRAVTLTRCTGSLRSSLGIIGGYSFNFLPYVTTCEIYSSGRGLHIEITKSDGFGISGMTTVVGFIALTFTEDV